MPPGINPTCHRDIWECLPPLFVGPPAKLAQLVQLLVGELHASFESCGRQLPPWRTFNATINRWMSPAFRDVPVPLRKGAQALPLGTPGLIPAADAQAFLRTCAKLVLLGGGSVGGAGRGIPSHGSIVRGGRSSSASSVSREWSVGVGVRRGRAEGCGSCGSGSSFSQHGGEWAGSRGSSGGKGLGQEAGGEGRGAAAGRGVGAGVTGAHGGPRGLERCGSGVSSSGEEAGERRRRREEMRQTARRILTVAAHRARSKARARVQEGFAAPGVGPAAAQGRGGVTAWDGPGMGRAVAAAAGGTEPGGAQGLLKRVGRPAEGALAPASAGDAARGGGGTVAAAAEAGPRGGAGGGAHGAAIVGVVQRGSRPRRPMGLLAKALQQQQQQEQQQQEEQQQEEQQQQRS